MKSVNNKELLNVRLAMREAVSSHIYDPNVMLIDFGWREKNRELHEDDLRIRIHVKQKIPRGEAMRKATLEGTTRGEFPKTIGDYKVNVPEAVYQLNHGLNNPISWWQRPVNVRTSRNNPMKGGISISDGYRYIAGTLGGLVTDRSTGDKMILSNFHVLAGVWHAREGWPIYQPGRSDGGRHRDLVAKLSRHAMSSNLDAAVARLTGSRELMNDQLDIGSVSGSAWAKPGMKVIKSGRTSDITRGVVSGVEGVFTGYYNGVSRLIRNVMTIEPRSGSEVSAGGDSGSFWLEEETMQAVGLHFAGRDYPKERALAIDMPPVLDALNVDLP